MDGPATTSIKPTAPRAVAARHTRDLNDIRMLKVRVKNVSTLGGDLIDFGAGNRNTADELSAAIRNPQFQYTARERKALQAEIDSSLICEAARRRAAKSWRTWRPARRWRRDRAGRKWRTRRRCATSLTRRRSPLPADCAPPDSRLRACARKVRLQVEAVFSFVALRSHHAAADAPFAKVSCDSEKERRNPSGSEIPGIGACGFPAPDTMIEP
jgi:hypothetical protein